jgi:Capsule assembly protein Wzi
MNNRLRLSVCASLCLLATGPLQARGVSPYLPLNLDPELEREVERVLILGDISVMTRPIPAARVIDALPKACAIDPILCRRVRRALKRYMQDSAVEFASIEGSAVSGDSKLVIPNRYGQTEQSQWQVAGAGFIQPGDHFLVNLGGVAYDGRQKATGSFISIGFDWGQVDFGYRDHWLSPMTDSAMLISTESPSMPGVTISNWRPLTRLGWQYEVFVERMSNTDNILLAVPPGGVTQGHPKFSGGRLGIEPANSGWSFSAQRIMVFGGGAAGGQSFSELLHAFFSPVGSQTTGLGGKPVLGKQGASITSRFLYPGHIPFSLYFEYAGNDSAGASNRFNFTKNDLSVGLPSPRLGPFDLTYEVSEWQPTWYGPHAGTSAQYGYGDGITNYLLSTGHWFGDQRRFAEPVGGQSNMLRVGVEPRFGGRLELTLRSLVNDSYYYSAPAPYEHEYMGSLMYSYPWKDYVVGSQVDYGRDVFGAHYTRVSAFLRYGDALHPGEEEDDEAAAAERPEGMEFHIDAGAVGSSVIADITANLPRTSTGVGFGPHLSVGARRAASAHQDLGAALEADGVHGLSLFGARFLDYRYRFDNPMALNLFLGVARYAAPTPAYGPYFGAGLQWRNILPKWDVGFDLRYATKVNRIRILPSDPQGGYRNDAFYDITYGTLYVSRKF